MGIQSVITLTGASQGIFLSMLFLSRKRKHPSMIILGVYILLYSCGLLEYFHDRNIAGTTEKLFFSFLANANLLYGPLIYLFIKQLRDKVLPIRTIILHTLPFVAFFFTDILFILNIVSLSDDVGAVTDLLAFEVLVLQLTSYSLVSLRSYKRMRNLLLNTYSSINNTDVNWMLYLLYLLTATYLLSFTFSHLLITGVISDQSIFVIIQVLVAIFTYLLGYRMFIRPSFFQLAFNVEHSISATKYKKSGLKPDKISVHLDALSELMKTCKPYKNPDISIFEIAEQLQISRNHLTEILNVHAGKNFNEYINEHRIEEAKKMLVDPGKAHLSITGIGKEAGFRSPNAFFINFKKYTGQTPANWKEKFSDKGIS